TRWGAWRRAKALDQHVPHNRDNFQDKVRRGGEGPARGGPSDVSAGVGKLSKGRTGGKGNYCTTGAGTMSGLWITVFTLPLLWTPITAIAPSPDDTLCPMNCSCSWLQRLVQCANASLSALPIGIANNTVELDLQHNSFGILSSGFFPDLPEITSLYLGSSHILQVASGAFKGVRNLYHLHLDNNLLEQLPQDAFHPHPTPRFLTVFLSLSLSGVFSSLKQLSVLDLSNNLLVELSDQALGGLSQLRRLYLTANRISNVSVRILPRSLRTLRLDQNQLESVPTVIRTSITLSILQLSGNPIRKLTSLSFGRRLRSLNQLFLDSLSLEKITALAFTRLHRLEVLSLRNNSLESLPSLASMRSLSTLYLTENKWCCDCSLIWLRTWQKKVTQQDRSPVECSSPTVLQGQLLVDLEVSTWCSQAGWSLAFKPSFSSLSLQGLVAVGRGLLHPLHALTWYSVLLGPVQKNGGGEEKKSISTRGSCTTAKLVEPWCHC
uniref:LRRCT domain-containing protein n=1 Tax=Crocodylus porosus TaxID=8502 RepID=A0A7M4FP66_CROPO